MKVRQSDADKDSLQKVSWWAVVRVRPLAFFCSGPSASHGSCWRRHRGSGHFRRLSKRVEPCCWPLRPGDEKALLRIFGPDGKEIISSGDGAEDKRSRDQFVQKYQEMHRLVEEPDG